MGLLQQASGLIQGGFTMDKITRGKALFEEAGSLFKRFQSGGQQQEEGVGVSFIDNIICCETNTVSTIAMRQKLTYIRYSTGRALRRGLEVRT